MRQTTEEVYFTKAQLQYLKDRFPEYVVTPSYEERKLLWCGGRLEVIKAVEDRVR